MARILIVAGNGRAVSLAEALIDDGHAVRVVAHRPGDGSALGRLGAEPVPGGLERIGTLRGALEHVAVVCWLLADASGPDEWVRELHGSRLQQFLLSAVDSSMCGFLYEAGGSLLPTDLLAAGEALVSETAARNSIPVAIIRADPSAVPAWLSEARAAVDELLTGARAITPTRRNGAGTLNAASALS